MKKFKTALYFLILFLIFAMVIGVGWVKEDFGDVSFDLLLYNLLAPKVGMNNTVLYEGIRHVIVYPMLVAIVLMACYWLCNTYLFSRYTIGMTWRRTNKTWKLNYRHRDWWLLVLVFALGLTTWFSANRLGIITYVQNMMIPSTLYEEYYVVPQDMEFVFPEEPKNLIYISLESVEMAFASTDVGGTQTENVMPNLTSLYEENINFTTGDSLVGFVPVEGTTWTAAALTAQFLGVPLTVPYGADYSNWEHFLPGAFGIGDILALADYNQVAVLGSDSDFGSRTTLYTDHGITDILDYKEAVTRGLIDEDYYVFWGYEDDKLFEYCKTELLRLAELDEPFFLATLTVDTHFEDGYVCEDCQELFGDQYSNVIYCSDSKVYEFVQWIMEQDFYEDTVIVIAGDHCTMDSDYLDGISEDYVRTVYHTIINADETASQGVEEQDRLYTTLDLYATTIASLGITWGEDRLALSTNLYSNTPTLAEELGLEELNSQICANSTYYDFQLLYDS